MEKHTTKTSLFGMALALAAVLLAASPARGQYESFFGRESWEYHIDYLMTCYMDDYDPNVFNACCETYSFDFHRDDTLRIGDNVYYHKALHYYYLDDVFLREDTVTGRLYGRYDTEGEEYLLCDMTLSVGDTFVLPDGSAQWNPHDYMMLVDSVSYTNGRKVIHLSIIDCDYEPFYDAESAPYMMSEYNISLRFMEGIGPIFGICPTSAFSLERTFGLLLCMHKDDTLCYMTHETLGCSQHGAGVPLYPQDYLQVYPNPVQGVVSLEFFTEEEIVGTVTVRDLVGRVCRQFTVTDKKLSLDISYLQPGVYMLTFTDEKNGVVTKKIVKQ